MKRILIVSMLLCAGAAAVQAQTPAINRLFTTPEERYRFDVERGTVAPPPAPAAPMPAEAPPAPLPPVTVDGFVRRSGGKSTVWINQIPQDGARNTFSGPAKTPRVSVTLPSGRKVLVKPGQRVDMNAGTVTDADQP